MKQPADVHCHVAIQVSNFEDAVAALKSRGVAFREPTLQSKKKIVYLQEPDPDGNPVHLIWLAET
jgi:hypothetical protein